MGASGASAVTPRPLRYNLVSLTHTAARRSSSSTPEGGGLRTAGIGGSMRTLWICVLLALAAAAGCGSRSDDKTARDPGGETRGSDRRSSRTLRLISGSENESLFSALDETGKVRKGPDGGSVDSDVVRSWEADNDVDVQVSYSGSVDIMN